MSPTTSSALFILPWVTLIFGFSAGYLALTVAGCAKEWLSLRRIKAQIRKINQP